MTAKPGKKICRSRVARVMFKPVAEAETGGDAILAERIVERIRPRDALNDALRQNGVSPSLCFRHGFEHHACHAATAYFLSWFRSHSKQMLIVTADASGDGLCATVSIGLQGRLERRHSITSYHSV